MSTQAVQWACSYVHKQKQINLERYLSVCSYELIESEAWASCDQFWQLILSGSGLR